jgi:hypothetical protein
MSNTFYPPIIKSVKLNTFRITDVKIKLFESATFTVLLFDQDNKLCDGRYYELDTEEYLQWNADDSWLVKWVKTKLQEESINS